MLFVNVGCGQRFHPDWINLDGDPVSAGIRRYDCREKLPLEDASVDAVYSSHVIEHLPREVARRFVRDVFRVLKSGGILRLATPDLEVLAFEYLRNLYRACDGDLEARDRHEWLVIELFDQFSRDTPGGLMLEYWKQNPMPCEDYVLERMGQEAKNFLSSYRSRPSSNAMCETEPQPPIDVEAASQVLWFERHRWLYDRLSLARLLAAIGFREVAVSAHNKSKIPSFEIYHLDALEDGSIRKPDSFFIEGVKPE
jgi:predicted SAM-dependent methyltransferase